MYIYIFFFIKKIKLIENFIFLLFFFKRIVQATGRRLVVPIVTIVTFNDDLFIKSKRIYWDQACVLKQVGLIPSILRCPFNGEDTDLPVKGIQQSDPLLTKEQFEEMNSMDILNRKLLKRQSYERFKDLRSVRLIKKNNKK